MKTYSRRNRRPIKRDSADLSDSGTIGMKKVESNRIFTGSPATQRSVRSISAPSAGVSPGASASAGSFCSRTEHQPQPQQQEQKKKNSTPREPRRSSSPSMCSLERSPLLPPAITAIDSVMTPRKSGDGSCRGDRGRRVLEGEDTRSGGSITLDGRRLWGGGGGGGSDISLGARRKRRIQHQGSSTKKRPVGAKGTAAAKGGKEQTFLDFGQKSFGQRILCPRCDMLYVCGAAEDEARHISLCAKTARGVEFAGWKQERVKARFADDGGRVLEVRNSDPAAHLAKLRDVERLMDAEMGFAPGAREEAYIGSSFGRNGVVNSGSGDARGGRGTAFVTPLTARKIATTTFLYVRKRRVLGCVVAQRIKTARRVLVDDVKGVRREGMGGNFATSGGASPVVEGKEKAAVTSTPSPVSRSTAPGSSVSDIAHVDSGGCAAASFNPPDGVDGIVGGGALVKTAAVVSAGVSTLPRKADSFWQGQRQNLADAEAAVNNDHIRGTPAGDGARREGGTADQNLGTPRSQQLGRRVVSNLRESPGFFLACKGGVQQLGGGVEVIRRSNSIEETGQDLRAWTAGADLLAPCHREAVDEEREVYCVALSVDAVRSHASGVEAVCGPDTENLSSLPAQSSQPSGSDVGSLLQRSGDGFDGEDVSCGGAIVYGYGGFLGETEGDRLEKGKVGGGSSGLNSSTEQEHDRKRDTLNDRTNMRQPGVALASAHAPAVDMELKRSRGLDRNDGETAGSTPLRSWSMESTSLSEASPPPPPVINGKSSSKTSLLPPMPPSVLVCEDEDTPTVVGILQIWVHERGRRQGVATRLVDTVREKMVYGVPLRRDQIAFSQPTRDGYAFAVKYTNSRLLVY